MNPPLRNPQSTLSIASFTLQGRGVAADVHAVIIPSAPAVESEDDAPKDAKGFLFARGDIVSAQSTPAYLHAAGNPGHLSLSPARGL